MYSNLKFLEQRLSKLVEQQISVKKESFYVEENFSSYAKFYINNKYSGVKVDLYDLTEYDRCGRLNHELVKLASKLKEIQ